MRRRHKILLIPAILAAMLAPFGMAFALCPDQIECLRHDGTVGYVIRYAPTCYKLFKGCRPWHCKDSDYANTDMHYWEHRCFEYISGICEDAYGRVLCKVDFPLY